MAPLTFVHALLTRTCAKLHLTAIGGKKKNKTAVTTLQSAIANLATGCVKSPPTMLQRARIKTANAFEKNLISKTFEKTHHGSHPRPEK